ncbi:hypothetical protein LCGC14_2571410, partial [marine sediment metagenome]
MGGESGEGGTDSLSIGVAKRQEAAGRCHDSSRGCAALIDELS